MSSQAGDARIFHFGLPPVRRRALPVIGNGSAIADFNAMAIWLRIGFSQEDAARTKK